MSSEADREREREEREEIMVARPNKFYALKRQLLIAAAAASSSDGAMPRFRHLFLKKNDSYFCIYYSRQKNPSQQL